MRIQDADPTPPGVSVAQSDALPLHQLACGQRARIQHVGVDRQARELTDRLARVGFRAGRDVEMVSRGLFGGEPWAVRVGDRTFALRRREAALVWVVR